MTKTLAVGEPAPNFDLASTEGVVLMLRDEVHRTKVLLYIFNDVETALPHLEQLARRCDDLLAKGVKVMAVSEATLAELEGAQRKLALPFPLLHDDRALAQAYVAEESVSTLALIGHDCRIELIESGPADVDATVAGVISGQDGTRGSTANYPGSVINRLVDRWVN